MANVPINEESLQLLHDRLAEVAGRLKRCVSLVAGKPGFTMAKAPPINDALPIVIDFTTAVESRLLNLETEAIFGTSVRARRRTRKPKT